MTTAPRGVSDSGTSPARRAPGGDARRDAQPAADARVDAARDRVVDEADGRRGRAEHTEDAAGDRGVHVADPARQRGQLFRREPGEVARLGLSLAHMPKRCTTEPVATRRPSGSVTRTSLKTRLRPRRATTACAVRSFPRAAAR